MHEYSIMGGLLSIPKFSSGSLKQLIIVLGVVVVFLFMVYVFTSMEAASSGGDFVYSVFGEDLKYGAVEGLSGMTIGVRPDYNPPPPPPPPPPSSSIPPIVAPAPVSISASSTPSSSAIASGSISSPAPAPTPISSVSKTTPIAVGGSTTTKQIIQVVM